MRHEDLTETQMITCQSSTLQIPKGSDMPLRAWRAAAAAAARELIPSSYRPSGPTRFHIQHGIPATITAHQPITRATR